MIDTICVVCGAHPFKVKDVKDPESRNPVGLFRCSCGYEMCVEYEERIVGQDKFKPKQELP